MNRARKFIVLHIVSHSAQPYKSLYLSYYEALM